MKSEQPERLLLLLHVAGLPSLFIRRAGGFELRPPSPQRRVRDAVRASSWRGSGGYCEAKRSCSGLPLDAARMTQAAASQPYFRSDSSDSAAQMLGDGPRAEKCRRKKRCSPVWLAVAAMGILAMQIASTTGLFVYFTMSISKVRGAGNRACLHLCRQFSGRNPQSPKMPKFSLRRPGKSLPGPRGAHTDA